MERHQSSEIRKSVVRTANRILNNNEDGISIYKLRIECEKVLGMKLQNAYIMMNLCSYDFMIDCKFYRIYKVK